MDLCVVLRMSRTFHWGTASPPHPSREIYSYGHTHLAFGSASVPLCDGSVRWVRKAKHIKPPLSVLNGIQSATFSADGTALSVRRNDPKAISIVASLHSFIDSKSAHDRCESFVQVHSQVAVCLRCPGLEVSICCVFITNTCCSVNYNYSNVALHYFMTRARILFPFYCILWCVFELKSASSVL